MIITFCGHSDFQPSTKYEKKILDLLEKKLEDQCTEIYLGGYGAFDNFAYDCCKKYKNSHPNVSLVFVAPYLSVEYQKKHLNEFQKKYDLIVYPEIENVPPKFAIAYRNRYMIEKANYVVAYITRSFGGAYTTYSYAKRNGKPIFNIAESNDQI